MARPASRERSRGSDTTVEFVNPGDDDKAAEDDVRVS